MEAFKYLALAKTLRADIACGKYRAGEKLPSENELTRTLGLSRQTVRQAILQLEQEGAILRVRGSGTFVKEQKMRTKSYNVAVITTYITDYIFPKVLSGIEKVLAGQQYVAMLASTQNRVDYERKRLEEFLGKNIDGFIIEGTKTALPNPNIDLYQRIEAMGLPVVFINGYYPDLHQPVYVISDDKKGGYRACEYLIEKGHQKIAGIFKSDDMQGLRRYAGMSAALRDNGLSVHDENILWYTTQDKDSLMDTLALTTLKDCTAVLCYNDEIAVRVVEQLRAKQIRIPQDMAVIAFDNSVLSDIAAVKITSLDYPMEALGAAAAQKLIHMMQGETETPLRMPWGFSEKEST